MEREKERETGSIGLSFGNLLKMLRFMFTAIFAFWLTNKMSMRQMHGTFALKGVYSHCKHRMQSICD